MPPCLTEHYKVWIKGKWSNPGKGVVPCPSSWGSSNWKGSLWITDFKKDSPLERHHNITTGTHIQQFNCINFLLMLSKLSLVPN